MCIRDRDYIKSKQLDNGGFEDNGTENIVSLSYVIQGLTDIGEDVNTQDWRFMPSRILSFKNEDGSYRFSEDGEQTFSEEATICALKACDTLSNSKSPYKKLMVSGTIQASAIDNMIPVFIVYGLSLIHISCRSYNCYSS